VAGCGRGRGSGCLLACLSPTGPSNNSLPPEDDAVEIEGVLDDARGGDARAQDVLLGGQVLGVGDAIGVADETAKGAEKEGLDFCRT